MTKSELRKYYKSKREQLTTIEIEEHSLKILQNLKEIPIWDKSNYHIYVPIKSQNEINTHLIISHLFELNKTVIVPKTEAQQMINCKIEKDVHWTKGQFGVPEPDRFEVVESEMIDVVFVPMLICDQSGNRVGYGGGYYDRFFEKLGDKALKIGINYFSPIDTINDVELTDVPLDYCVTSSEIVSFIS